MLIGRKTIVIQILAHELIMRRIGFDRIKTNVIDAERTGCKTAGDNPRAQTSPEFHGDKLPFRMAYTFQNANPLNGFGVKVAGNGKWGNLPVQLASTCPE